MFNKKDLMPKKVFEGNINEKGATKKSWFIGHFMEGPLKTKNFELKWGKHQKGEKDTNAESYSKAKTIGILIYGKFRFEFPGINKKITLSQEGDYCFYDAGISHNWRVLEDCLILSIRWPSIPKN